MKLNKRQRKILMGYGYSEEDIPQIEEAIGKTKFTLMSGGKEKRITIKKTMSILDENNFLTGVGRSAFHWTSVRDNEKGQSVHFDSSRLFRE